MTKRTNEPAHTDEEFTEALTSGEGEPGETAQERTPTNGNGNGHAVGEQGPAPPTSEAPEQALARQQAETWGALARQCGTATRLWLRRERDPEDKRPMQFGIFGEPLIGGFSDGTDLGQKVTDKLGGGGLIFVTPDNPYDFTRPTPPRWHGPNRMLGEPKQIGLDRVDADGRPAEHVAAGSPAAATAPAAPAPAPGEGPPGYVTVIDDETGDFHLLPQAVAERRAREKRAAREKREADTAALAGLADVRAKLESDQRGFMEKVLDQLKGIREERAVRAVPERDVEKGYLERMLSLKEKELEAAKAQSLADAAKASADLQVRLRQLELDAAARPPAAQSAPSAMSGDPFKLIDTVMSLVEKTQKVTGVGPAGAAAEESATSVMKSFLGELTGAARVLYGDPGAERSAGGPLRRLAEAMVDQAEYVVPRQGTPAAGTPREPEPSKLTNAEKKAALETIEKDLTAAATMLMAVLSGAVDPEEGWKELRPKLSAGFVADVRGWRTPEDLAGVLKALSEKTALKNYANEFRTMAAQTLGTGRRYAERFLAAAQEG